MFPAAHTPQLIEDAQKAIQQGRSERRRRTLRHVEPLSEARTLLGGFFSILLMMRE